MTPEEAQGKTECKWEDRSKKYYSKLECGWCEFAHFSCLECPLPRVFEYEEWKAGCECFPPWIAFQETLPSSEEEKEAAAKLYTLLIENREEIIKTAYEILAEF